MQKGAQILTRDRVIDVEPSITILTENGERKGLRIKVSQGLELEAKWDSSVDRKAVLIEVNEVAKILRMKYRRPKRLTELYQHRAVCLVDNDGKHCVYCDSEPTALRRKEI